MYYENNCQQNGLSKEKGIVWGSKPGLQPGDVAYGGYFAGTFLLGGEHYGLVASPGNQGEFSDIVWGGYRIDVNSSSYIDGLANTMAMAEAGNDTAKEILQMRIDLFGDWYIPARDELELIYRNLKPSNDVNLTSFRDGENPSSEPPGYPYTAASPIQTEVEAFQLAGEQAMETTWYWSSTQSSVYAAWIQSFKDGSQRTNHKVGAGSVRAVRRFRISPGEPRQ